MSATFSFSVFLPRLSREIKTAASISQPFNILSALPGRHPIFHGFEALWDTGAVATVISQRVVTTCGLLPTGMTRVRTTLATADCEVYLVNLSLQNRVFFPSIHVTKAELGPNVDILMEWT